MGQKPLEGVRVQRSRDEPRQGQPKHDAPAQTWQPGLQLCFGSCQKQTAPGWLPFNCKAERELMTFSSEERDFYFLSVLWVSMVFMLEEKGRERGYLYLVVRETVPLVLDISHVIWNEMKKKQKSATLCNARHQCSWRKADKAKELKKNKRISKNMQATENVLKCCRTSGSSKIF